MAASELTVIDGPTGYLNWKAQDDGAPLQETVEFSLYSDAHLTGEIREGLGPYRILNTIAIARASSDRVLPAAVLRARIHFQVESSEMKSTKDQGWHAGGMDDELAALFGLTFGVRMQSGGATRVFETDGDLFGRPQEYTHYPRSLPPISTRAHLPNVMKTHRIDEAVEVLSGYPLLSPVAATALLRAARSYQAGLWNSEEDPEYAWLKLVSAVEAVADIWWIGDHSSDELLKDWDPELVERLELTGGAEMVSFVADRLVSVTRSTRKFLDFLLEFSPEPPTERPPEAMQVDWKRLRPALQKIYGYRSKALHESTPFPGPLLSPPLRAEDPEERPLGESWAFGGSVWLAKDLPMNLHAFEYIVRNSILRWWRGSLNLES